jgi:hypothetical protein
MLAEPSLKNYHLPSVRGDLLSKVTATKPEPSLRAAALTKMRGKNVVA